MNTYLPLLVVALVPGFLPLSSLAQAPIAAAPAASSSDLSQYTTADALWLHIQDVKKGPKTRPTTAQEYQTVMTAMIAQLSAASTDFLKRFPNDPRRWDARLLQIETGSAVDSMGGRRSDLELSGQLQDLASRADAPAAVRGQARYELLGLAVRHCTQGDPSITSASVVTQLHQFISDFPTYPSLDVLKYKIAEAINPLDPGAASSLLKELADSGEGKIADQARTELQTREKLKSPLDLRFTAVDGSEVDLSKLRGKVVLVDFWATWCGPCRGELPNVMAAYQKLHGKGFEIVGISLDQDKTSLVNFTAENGMKWPQYFDGKGWANGISSGLGIQSIPAMWLVNKKGYVVTTNGRENLEGQVEKLLAE
jgi:thiol-disulfide isomerase/thioredoxin